MIEFILGSLIARKGIVETVGLWRPEWDPWHRQCPSSSIINNNALYNQQTEKIFFGKPGSLAWGSLQHVHPCSREGRWPKSFSGQSWEKPRTAYKYGIKQKFLFQNPNSVFTVLGTQECMVILLQKWTIPLNYILKCCRFM